MAAVVYQSKLAISISIASSSNKEEWLNEAIASFDATCRTSAALQLDGKPVSVDVVLEQLEPGKKDHYRSGSMVADIPCPARSNPTIASPAEKFWISKLNNDWQVANSKPITTEPCTGYGAHTTRHRHVGNREPRPWSAGHLRERRIRALATNADGWTMFGRPDWGKFKLGYGHMDQSNSGTLTAAILCIRGLGKSGDLTMEDVDAGNGCGRMIAAVEKAKVHSGKRSAWLNEQMRTGGPEYLGRYRHQRTGGSRIQP